MERFKYLFFILLLTIISCTRVYRFDDEDFNLIPYKIGEVLVFKSNLGDIDTLVITGQGRYMDSPQSFDTAPDSLEKYFLNYTYNDRRPKNANEPDETIMGMHRNRDNKTEVGFGLVTDDCFFYGLRYYDIDYFKNAKTEKLKIKEKDYSDVIVIEPTTENQKYSTREHFVSKMYWSKSRGLMKFNKSNGITYERIN